MRIAIIFLASVLTLQSYANSSTSPNDPPPEVKHSKGSKNKGGSNTSTGSGTSSGTQGQPESEGGYLKLGSGVKKLEQQDKGPAKKGADQVNGGRAQDIEKTGLAAQKDSTFILLPGPTADTNLMVVTTYTGEKHQTVVKKNKDAKTQEEARKAKFFQDADGTEKNSMTLARLRGAAGLNGVESYNVNEGKGETLGGFFGVEGENNAHYMPTKRKLQKAMQANQTKGEDGLVTDLLSEVAKNDDGTVKMDKASGQAIHIILGGGGGGGGGAAKKGAGGAGDAPAI